MWQMVHRSPNVRRAPREWHGNEGGSRMQERRISGACGRCPGMGIPASIGSRLREVSHQCRTMLGGGRGSSHRRRITQLASNGNPRLSLPTGEVDAFVSVERAAAFRRNLSVAVRANEDQQSTRRARLFALPRRSAVGHEERFLSGRRSDRCGLRKRSVAVDDWATWAFGSGSKLSF